MATFRQANARARKEQKGPSGSTTAPEAGSRMAGARSRASWGVLVYLAGDTRWGHEALRDDLDEILKTGGSADLMLAVQLDGPDGAYRYIVPPHPSPNLPPTQTLGRVDSGRTTALLDFLRWGMTVCQSDRLAFVLGSPLTVTPAEENSANLNNVLALTYDHGSGNYLDVSELAGVIREALSDVDRDQIDLVAIDSCYVQFLELAYELEDIARILIAPQTTIPMAGWDYVRVLSRWKELAAAGPSIGTPSVATELLADIIACYEEGDTPRAVSALDLQRLEDVAHAFDTLCMGTMQVLGEGLIWKARELLLNEMQATTAGPVYDCGSFFALWGTTLRTLADEAYQGWLGTTLERASGDMLDRFCEAMARYLESDGAGAVASTPSVVASPDTRERLSLLIATLRDPDRQHAGTKFLTEVGRGVLARIALLKPGTPENVRIAAKEAAAERERAVSAAVSQARRLLPEERLFDLSRTEDAADNARRLARQFGSGTVRAAGRRDRRVTWDGARR